MTRDATEKTLAFVILGVFGLAFVYLTYLDFRDVYDIDNPLRAINESAAIVLAHPPADGSKRWTVTEVLKGDQPHHTLNLRSLPRLYRDTPPPPEGVVCLFDRQYHWFGSLTIRRTLDLRDGLVGSTGLTLEQFRQLVDHPE